MKITVISGTNRPGAVSKVVAQYIGEEIKASMPAGGEVTLLDLHELPQELFLPAAYSEKPASFEPFKKAILEADGVISVLPEYNGSAPGVFKYFLDMLPFPESLKDMPAAFVGLSAGKFGNVRGVEDMMGVFQYRYANVYPYRIFLNAVQDNLDERGMPKDDFVRNLFQEQLRGFVEFAKKVKITA